MELAFVIVFLFLEPMQGLCAPLLRKASLQPSHLNTGLGVRWHQEAETGRRLTNKTLSASETTHRDADVIARVKPYHSLSQVGQNSFEQKTHQWIDNTANEGFVFQVRHSFNERVGVTNPVLIMTLALAPGWVFFCCLCLGFMSWYPCCGYIFGFKLQKQHTPARGDDKLPPIVFVHGLKGGFLRDDANNRRYLLFRQMLDWGEDQFPLPLTFKGENGDGPQESDGLVPDGPFWGIYVLGCITLADSYGSFIDEFRKTREVLLFSYDWRRELAETGRAFEAFLDNVKKEHGRDIGAQVVCHSMGGLITFPVLNRRPDLFHSVLFVGAALGSGVQVMPDVSDCECEANQFLFNPNMTLPYHWLGWPSIYHFFPLPEDKLNGLGKPHLMEADGSPVECDFGNIEHWKSLKLGPYHPKSKVTMDSNSETFFAEVLRRAQAYRRLVVKDPAVNYPPITAMTSDSVATISSLKRDGPDQAFNMIEGFETTPGDGRVYGTGFHPPDGVPVLRSLNTGHSHGQFFGDHDSIRTLLNEMIIEAERKGMSSGSRSDVTKS